MAYYNNYFPIDCINFDEIKHVFHTITNFEPERLGWYDKAVRLHNKRNKNARVYIVREAYDCNGHLIPGWFSVKYSGVDPRSDFWDCFDLVKAKYPVPPVARNVRIKKGTGRPMMCTWAEEHYWSNHAHSIYPFEKSLLPLFAQVAKDKNQRNDIMFIDARKK